ncbi:hypothetical protein ACO0K3_07475 [Undibacterium sp. Rencai35W]|uniref:hypothetical protein n=1 Tax=Undibacterium sp. Rencai35W TaxID=3413046 RepID=UPI003BF3AF9C
MIITSSDILLASSSASSSQLDVHESTRAWVGRQRPNFDNPRTPLDFNESGSTVQLSDAGRIALAKDQTSFSSVKHGDAADEAQAIEQANAAVENDPKLRLIISLIERLTGRKINLFHASDLASSENTSKVPSIISDDASDGAFGSAHVPSSAPSRNAGWGLEYQRQSSYTETEQTSFQATGLIHTADNQEIKFKLSIQLQRSYHEESNVSVQAGDGKKIDPLVINFSANSAQLTSQKFSFDLNADGIKESISFVQGAGFLALDKNGDGKINDGSELFGPATGSGFNELKALDSDGNGWIDEADPAFQQLRVWTKDASGKDKLSTLKQADVGALFLGNASTPFSIKNAQNHSQGQLVSSGLWLSEEGKIGSLQQIDLIA